MRTHSYTLKNGITPTPEFAKKRLAQFAVNVGLRCGHDCTYCSSRAKCAKAQSLQRPGRKAILDRLSPSSIPRLPERVAADAKRLPKRGMVQLCTTVDAWAPEAQEYDLGRRCLEAILSPAGVASADSDEKCGGRERL